MSDPHPFHRPPSPTSPGFFQPYPFSPFPLPLSYGEPAESPAPDEYGGWATGLHAGYKDALRMGISTDPLRSIEGRVGAQEWSAGGAGQGEGRGQGEAGPSNSGVHERDTNYEYIPEPLASSSYNHTVDDDSQPLTPEVIRARQEAAATTADDIMRALGLAVSVAANDMPITSLAKGANGQMLESVNPEVLRWDPTSAEEVPRLEGGEVEMEQEEPVDMGPVELPPPAVFPDELIIKGISVIPIINHISTLTSPHLLLEVHRILDRHRTPRTYHRVDVRISDPDTIDRLKAEEVQRAKDKRSKKKGKGKAVDPNLEPSAGVIGDERMDPTGRGQGGMVPQVAGQEQGVEGVRRAEQPVAAPPPIIRELRIDINTIHHSALYHLEEFRRRNVGEPLLEVPYLEYLERLTLVPLAVEERPVVEEEKKRGRKKKIEVVDVDAMEVDGEDEGDVEDLEEDEDVKDKDSEASDYEAAMHGRPSRRSVTIRSDGTSQPKKRGRPRGPYNKSKTQPDGRQRKSRRRGEPSSAGAIQSAGSEDDHGQDDYAMDNDDSGGMGYFFPGDDSYQDTGPLEPPTPRPAEWDYESDLDWDGLEGQSLNDLLTGKVQGGSDEEEEQGSKGKGKSRERGKSREDTPLRSSRSGRGAREEPIEVDEASSSSRRTRSGGDAEAQIDALVPKVRTMARKTTPEPSIFQRMLGNANNSTPKSRTTAKKTAPAASSFPTSLSRRTRATSSSSQFGTPASQKKSVPFAVADRSIRALPTPSRLPVVEVAGGRKAGGTVHRGTVTSGWVGPSTGAAGLSSGTPSATKKRPALILSDSEEDSDVQIAAKKPVEKKKRLVMQVIIPRKSKAELAEFARARPSSHKKKVPGMVQQPFQALTPLSSKPAPKAKPSTNKHRAAGPSNPTNGTNGSFQNAHASSDIDHDTSGEIDHPESSGVESEDGHVAYRRVDTGKGKGREVVEVSDSEAEGGEVPAMAAEEDANGKTEAETGAQVLEESDDESEEGEDEWSFLQE